MALDFLITATTIEEGAVPAWEMAERAIAELPDSALDDEFCDEGFEDVAELRAQLVDDLRDFRDAFSEPLRRDAQTVAVRGLVLFMAGGMSAGDPPSALYAAMKRLLCAGVLAPAGFGAK